MTPVPVPDTGEPEAMRVVAREWVARAAVLDELAGVVASTAATMGLDGPAATRLVDQCDAARQSAAVAAEDLRALAAELLRDAAGAEEAAAEAQAQAEAEAERAQAERTQAERGPEEPAPDIARPAPPADEELPGGGA